MIYTPDTLPSRSLACDVAIIGSGAGGATAAYALSAAGLDVVVLETGGHFTEADFSQDYGRASTQLLEEAGQRIMRGNLFVPVVGGRCLGGSTVVNSGICFRIPESRFDAWSEQAHLDFSFTELMAKTRVVEQTIGVAASNRAVWGKNNAFCQKGLEALGWSGGPMPRNAPGCVGCGSCNTGCPTGQKLSVAKTFIPMAEAHGARFLTRARADSFLFEGGDRGPRARINGVRATLLEGIDDEARGEVTVRARAVVLAGGAIQSPVLFSSKVGSATPTLASTCTSTSQRAASPQPPKTSSAGAAFLRASTRTSSSRQTR